MLESNGGSELGRQCTIRIFVFIVVSVLLMCNFFVYTFAEDESTPLPEADIEGVESESDVVDIDTYIEGESDLVEPSIDDDVLEPDPEGDLLEPEGESLNPEGEAVEIESENDIDELHVGTLIVGSMLDDVILYSLPDDNEYPGGQLRYGLYMDVNTSQLGRVMIYVPVDFQRGSFTFNTANNIVNIRSSTITGYMYRNNTLYDIRWTSLTTAQYRQNGTSNAYQALNISTIYNTNVVFVEQSSDLPVVPNSELYQLITIMIAGVIMFCLFMKRF